MRNRKQYLIGITAAIVLVIGGISLFTRPVKAETAQGVRSTIATPQARPITNLQVDRVTRRGEMIEVKGRTEPNADVSVNGNPVPYVAKDGSFSFFMRTTTPEKTRSVTVEAQASGKEPVRIDAPVTQ